jgi:hypothetical protein
VRIDVPYVYVLPFPSKNRLDAGSPRLGIKSLGEISASCFEVSTRIRRRCPFWTASWAKCFRMSIRKLGTLSASDNVVAPLNTNVMVLVDWGPGLWSKTHVPQEVSEINHLNSRRGC